MKNMLSIIAFFILVSTGVYFALNSWKFLPIKQVNERESGGVISGRVSLGPICPVVSDPPESKCNDKPFQAKLEVVTNDGARVVKEFSSDTNGEFSIKIPPGEYLIRSKPSQEVFPYCKADDVISASPNKPIEVIVLCDTGIR